MKRLGLAISMLLCACGGASDASLPVGGPLRVEVATTAASPEWLQRSDLAEHTLAAATAAAQQWGGADLRGWKIRFVSHIDDCAAATPAGPVMGCTRHDALTIDLSVDPASPCVEGTALLHEIGHVAIPDDPDHRDPRWASGEFWVGLLGAVEGEAQGSGSACADALASWQLWWRARGG